MTGWGLAVGEWGLGIGDWGLGVGGWDGSENHSGEILLYD